MARRLDVVAVNQANVNYYYLVNSEGRNGVLRERVGEGVRSLTAGLCAFLQG